MYKFADTVAGSGLSTPHLSLNTVFNGVNLDESLTDKSGSFTTIAVSGRGILPRNIHMTEMSGSHGAREKRYTYDVREITVKYKLTDRSNEGFRERFNRLNGLLLGSKKRLQFTDEDAYFLATLQSGDTPEEDSNDIVGTLVFICTNPAKNRNEQTLNITTTTQAFTIGGMESTPWTSQTRFTAPQSSFRLETDNGGKIILHYDFIDGDVLEINYETRNVFLNGKDVAVSIALETEWFELNPGLVSMRASHETALNYAERFY
ncbi:distal tail protein Dit [Bacillus norwichensis]|uniref:Phage tail family protein n=1 Tax=Bacillus norwichensis TaxID=2762217 RepID=A0ABR8VP34_9BACI|nr:distal tail protein Dit [Bacillus norwichensis]MBD8006527.1 phage tail family protein [Bacillus norwichensis]